MGNCVLEDEKLDYLELHNVVNLWINIRKYDILNILNRSREFITNIFFRQFQI